MTNHSTQRSSRSFEISRDHSTPRSSRRHHHFTSPLDLEVERLHLHHLTITRSHHSTPRSSVFTTITWSSLDYITLPGSRVSPSPPLDYTLDGKLQSLLHSALNQTLEHKEEKKTPAIHSTSHSTTWVEYSYHPAVTLLLSCFQHVQRLCFLLWCLSSE